MIFHAAQYGIIAIVLHAIDSQIVWIGPCKLITIGATIEQTKCCIIISSQYCLIVFPQNIVNGHRRRIENGFRLARTRKWNEANWMRLQRANRQLHTFPYRVIVMLFELDHCISRWPNVSHPAIDADTYYRRHHLDCPVDPGTERPIHIDVSTRMSHSMLSSRIDHQRNRHIPFGTYSFCRFVRWSVHCHCCYRTMLSWCDRLDVPWKLCHLFWWKTLYPNRYGTRTFCTVSVTGFDGLWHVCAHVAHRHAWCTTIPFPNAIATDWIVADGIARVPHIVRSTNFGINERVRDTSSCATFYNCEIWNEPKNRQYKGLGSAKREKPFNEPFGAYANVWITMSDHQQIQTFREESETCCNRLEASAHIIQSNHIVDWAFLENVSQHIIIQFGYQHLRTTLTPSNFDFATTIYPLSVRCAIIRWFSYYCVDVSELM